MRDPTRREKQLLSSRRLDPANWLIKKMHEQERKRHYGNQLSGSRNRRHPRDPD